MSGGTADDQVAAEHLANSPETWQVVKAADRCWQLQNAHGHTLEAFKTRKAAEANRSDGFWFHWWHRTARWHAGGDVAGWRPYAEARAERERGETLRVFR